MSIDQGYPQFINLDQNLIDKKLKPLIENSNSQFHGFEQGQVYMIAVALGFSNKVFTKSSKSKGVRTYNQLRDEYKVMFRVIAILHTNYNYEVVKDGSRVIKIIEEYANAGVELLYEKIFNSGPDFSIEDEVWEKIRK